MKNKIKFTRVNNDGNGNPRYVCHFLNFIKDSDRENEPTYFMNFNMGYDLALKRAKKIGGKKFHNKQYGGGVVFQSYNIQETEKSIHELMKQF